MARIAVIGAGMGSLAAAARLATGGHRVVVLERAASYGGALGQVARDGFAFDTGPGLLLLPAVQRDLFVKTGRESLERSVGLEQADPASRHVFADGTEVVLPNASRSGVMEALDGVLGAGRGERWSAVMLRAREAWEATRRPLLEDALGEDTGPLGRDPYPAVRRRGLLRRPAPPTLAGIADRELRDPRLAALLESHALAYGFDPRTVPAAAAVLAYVEQTFGVWYVRGGMRALADAVYARCLARKVEFRFGAEVVGLTEKDGRATGAELADGDVVEADVVVAGAPLPALRGEGEGARPLVPGRLTVHLALRGARPASTPHRTVVHAPDRVAALDAVFRPESGGTAVPPTVTVLRPDDPAGRPDDAHEAVTLQVTVAPHAPRAPEGVDWEAPGFADTRAAAAVAAAEAAVPGLRERELFRLVRTPADTARDTGAPGGAVPRPALPGADGGYLHPANRSPLPNLYFVGGWSHPGGGLPHAGMSGAIVSDLIAGGPGGSR
ncbi:NAD(P)/FAD-dependent oxidoreductase [Streptomyces sp. NPDC051976]|uniref:phytoene desaturase family protein n=1 Tax=Streptomyces sp. NPDC051976 TaxID=3154947 RepID=UPI00343D5BDB